MVIYEKMLGLVHFETESILSLEIKIIIVIFRYMKDTNQKTNIKPPDLWIHHDQMELKALEKSSINGEASTSGVASNTLPRSNNQEYNQENVHGNSSSLDKRTYVPSYMGKFLKIILFYRTLHHVKHNTYKILFI